MTKLYDFTRAEWGARPAAYTNPLDYSRVRHLILHYPGTRNPIGTDLEAIRRALKNKIGKMLRSHLGKPPV